MYTLAASEGRGGSKGKSLAKGLYLDHESRLRWMPGEGLPLQFYTLALSENEGKNREKRSDLKGE